VVVFWVVSPLEVVGFGPLIDLSGLGQHRVGVRASGGGLIVVEDAPCTATSRSAVVLRAADRSVVWRAEAESGSAAPIGPVTIGTPPSGFREAVPLSRPLDPQATYTVELYLIPPPPETVLPSTATTVSASVIGADTATFRPADLRTDGVWFDGRLVTAPEFQREACDEA
jgi:hypothetical protein